MLGVSKTAYVKLGENVASAGWWRTPQVKMHIYVSKQGDLKFGGEKRWRRCHILANFEFQRGGFQKERIKEEFSVL